jgi:hypothetical protein
VPVKRPAKHKKCHFLWYASDIELWKESINHNSFVEIYVFILLLLLLLFKKQNTLSCN